MTGLLAVTSLALLLRIINVQGFLRFRPAPAAVATASLEKDKADATALATA